MKNFLLDTNVLMSDPKAFLSFKNNNVSISSVILSELDKAKTYNDEAGHNARQSIRFIEALRKKGDLLEGVQMSKSHGKFFVYNDEFLLEMGKSVDDSLILSAKQRNLIIISNDINVRIKASIQNIEANEYLSPKTRFKLFSGIKEILVSDEIIDNIYKGSKLYTKDLGIEKSRLKPHQFLILKGSSGSKTAFVRFIKHSLALKKVNNAKKEISGVAPRNKEQIMAMDLLLDDNVKVVSLVGLAGSGKSLISLAVGLHLVTNLRNEKYKKMIVMRPIQPMGKDLGFLPGTLEEKMDPWLSPIRDNISFMLGDDQYQLEELKRKGILEIEAMTYIRGRSIPDAFIIIDEAQNLSNHEIKTIITRVGEGTKIVLTGDIDQIDNQKLSHSSNGLTNAVEKFKDQDVSGHMTLIKGERSKVASLAAKIL